MCPINLNRNPQFIAEIFSQHVKALVMILAWTIVALTSICITYVVIRGLWAGVTYFLTAVFGA